MKNINLKFKRKGSGCFNSCTKC